MPPNNSQTDSTHTQVPHSKIAKAIKRVIVGIDFGTSTTKAMYRPVELGASTRLIDFAHGHRKFPSYAMPSSVRLDSEHRMWFGAIAEDGHGQIFRSFKVCVACQVGAISCRGCNQNDAEKNALPLGRFADSLFGFITAYELMVYYLAWLLHEVDKIIRRELGEFVEPELQYNLGVPVAHLNAKPELVDRFEWILHTAVALRGKIQQGISAMQARSLLIEILPDSMLPPPDYRRHRALPETVAAAMWLQKNANGIDSTNYMLVDIGAGTTDITIYRYNQVNSDKLPIYGAKSVSVAGDNIDFSTIQWFARKYGVEIGNASQLPSALRQEIRCRKEILPRPDKPMEAVLGKKMIALDEQTYIREIVKPHAESIYTATNETFRDAYQLAHHVLQWPEMRIVLLGGGSRIVGMRQYFKDHRLRHFMEQHVLEQQIATNVDMTGVKDFQLLAVAYGLAFPFAEFPGVRMPNQIQPMQQDEPTQEPEYNENALLSN